MSMRRPETESELVELVRSIDVSAPEHRCTSASMRSSRESEQQQAPPLTARTRAPLARGGSGRCARPSRRRC